MDIQISAQGAYSWLTGKAQQGVLLQPGPQETSWSLYQFACSMAGALDDIADTD